MFNFIKNYLEFLQNRNYFPNMKRLFKNTDMFKLSLVLLTISFAFICCSKSLYANDVESKLYDEDSFAIDDKEDQVGEDDDLSQECPMEEDHEDCDEDDQDEDIKVFLTTWKNTLSKSPKAFYELLVSLRDDCEIAIIEEVLDTLPTLEAWKSLLVKDPELSDKILSVIPECGEEDANDEEDVKN